MREKVSKIAHEYAVINLFYSYMRYEYSIKDVFQECSTPRITSFLGVEHFDSLNGT